MQTEQNKQTIKRFETAINTADETLAEELVAEGNTVAVRWTCTGTHQGDFLGAPATGKKFAVCFMNFYEFNQDGKITKDTAGTGMIGILQQLQLFK